MLLSDQLLFVFTLFYKQLIKGLRVQLFSVTDRFEDSQLLSNCLIRDICSLNYFFKYYCRSSGRTFQQNNTVEI